MIVDTSAIIAVIFREPGHEVLLNKLSEAEIIGIGTPTLAEAGIVLTARQTADATITLARIVQAFEITTIPFVEAHWKEAVAAYRRYGKGRRPAGLNFGDCMTYATAKLAGQPLLFVGEDFSKTDLEVA